MKINNVLTDGDHVWIFLNKEHSSITEWMEKAFYPDLLRRKEMDEFDINNDSAE